MMTWFSLLMLPFARAAAVVTRPISIDTATDTLVLPDIDFLLCGRCDNRLAPTTRGNLVSRGRRQQRSSVTDFEWATSSETTRCCRLADVSTGMTTRRLVSFIDPLCPRPKESHVEGMPPKPVYNRLDRRETGLAYAQVPLDVGSIPSNGAQPRDRQPVAFAACSCGRIHAARRVGPLVFPRTYHRLSRIRPGAARNDEPRSPG